jgi:hypothetical protein
MSGTDLSRLLDASSKLGPMILCGDRSITAEHARILGKHLASPPDYSSSEFLTPLSSECLWMMSAKPPDPLCLRARFSAAGWRA